MRPTCVCSECFVLHFVSCEILEIVLLMCEMYRPGTVQVKAQSLHAISRSRTSTLPYDSVACIHVAYYLCRSKPVYSKNQVLYKLNSFGVTIVEWFTKLFICEIICVMFVCICMCVSLCVCVCVFKAMVCLTLCVCMGVCVRLSVCVCVCVSLCA